MIKKTPIILLLIILNLQQVNAQTLDDTSLDKIMNVQAVSLDCIQSGPIEIKKESQIGNDTNNEYVLGSITFKEDCGGLMERKVYVKVLFDKIYPENSWIYRIKRNESWQDIPRLSITLNKTDFTTSDGTKKTVSVASYEVTDGGYLDSDGQRNGFIGQHLGFAQISDAILSKPVTITDTLGKTGKESLTVKGVCEIGSIISILNHGNVLDNARIICSSGFFNFTLFFPKGTLTKQQISVFQKNLNTNGLGDVVPYSVTIDAEQKQEKLSEFMFYRNLKIFDIGTDVRALQSMLNNAGFPVAKEGGGSLGKETEQLSNNTWKAVRRFQNEMGIGGEEKKISGKTIRKLKAILKTKGL